MKNYESWGRYPKVKPSLVKSLFWRNEIPDFKNFDKPLLPFAYGRSYGDTCLNGDGTLIDVSNLNKFISLDDKNGILCCEAGITLAEILKLIVPRGWFLPVTPGTKYASVGGCIANDVHGKNHPQKGTFGAHISRFELLRSTGETVQCSPKQNTELFQATIGGLGLTGIILSAELRLKRISGPCMEVQQKPFSSLNELFELLNSLDEKFEYFIAWLDCLSMNKRITRGILSSGNHKETNGQHGQQKKSPRVNIPFDLPFSLINNFTVQCFNWIHYHARFTKNSHHELSYESFLYPLDLIGNWNRLYGPSGFLQFQCVVPYQDAYETIKEVFTRIRHSKKFIALGVLKKFGTIKSPGMLSFPRPGLSLSFDLPFQGSSTLKLLDELDGIIKSSKGAVYPAKDARMAPESFQSYFPNWQLFSTYVDPRFSSSFWRRVTKSP